MTVSEMRALLAPYPDDMEVMGPARDGDGFHPLCLDCAKIELVCPCTDERNRHNGIWEIVDEYTMPPFQLAHSKTVLTIE